MAVYRYVDLDIKEAELLSDLTGIKHDLEKTLEICDRLEDALTDLFKGVQSDIIILEVLNSAVLIRYSRPFTTGVRANFSSYLLEGLPPELLDRHKFFKDLRDKYIAHSVNAFEENRVVAYLAPEELGKREVRSISVQESRLTSLELEDIHHLKELCQHFRTKISEMIEEERSNLLEIASKLPIDELYAQEPRAATPVSQINVHKPRKRL